MADDAGLKIAIEPFNPDKHDRTAFSCGAGRIDNFLKRSAKKHQKGDFTRVWVATSPGENGILGFYAVNSHALAGDELPARLTKNAPRHGVIPAAYLSMVGVDGALQGHGLGRILLIDAIKRIARVAEEMGVAAIILDVLDDDGPEAAAKRKSFYESFGFQAFPSQPRRMFLPTRVARKLL